MAKGKITGSIMGDDGTVYREGDEAAFGEWLDSMTPERRKASLAHLSKHQQLEGFGAPKAAELTEADPTLAAHAEDDDDEHIIAGEPSKAAKKGGRK